MRGAARARDLLFRAARWRQSRAPERARVRRVAGEPLLILPGVFDPVATVAGCWLAEQVRGLILPGERWLEVGCGTGVVGLAMAEAGAEVFCVDIDPEAVRNTRINAALRRLPIRVEQSDLFDAMEGARFDGVVANLPWWPGEPDGSRWSRAMRAGASLELLRRFSAAWPRHAPRAVLVLSEAGGHAAAARAALGDPALIRAEVRHGERLLLLESAVLPAV